MSAVGEAVKAEVGCYDLRGPDFETLLLGTITGSIGDADRLVRRGNRRGDSGWSNGFPNWAMYRTALAGDSHLAANLRAWCEAFGMAYVEAGGARKGGDALGVCAGRDAFVMLTESRWGAPAEELAPLLGVTAKTYREHRRALLARLKVSLAEYWMRMEIAMREVALMERRQESPRPIVELADGRGFEGEWSADGNFRAYPKKFL